ncbi:MAG: YitT family protein [Christensenellaceae bacterium]|nr:YitT family protein [Christensenellaceae bacterium]
MPRPTLSRVLLALLGSLIQAVGVSSVHAWSSVTEGGVLGMTLLLHHWLAITPAASSLLLNALCYLLGWRTLGREFLLYSIISGAGFSLFYAIAEPFAPLFPALIASPLAAALSGAVFVGVGAGLCVRVGGAPGGDDALAMALSHLTRVPIQWIYLLTDAVVLGLSLSYIPLARLLYSLLTVVLSGQIIGLMQRLPLPPRGRSIGC